MNRQVFVPNNEQEWLKLRSEDITSTEVSALFGLSPYLSEFELWHRKKNKTIDPIAVNERMKWGTRLQEAIAKGIATDNQWMVRGMSEYIRVPDQRIGSSFDYRVFGQATPLEEFNSTLAILEIKNVDSLAFKDGWEEDAEGNLEAPLHIEMQVQHQLLVSGLETAYIGALVGGNNVKLIKRTADKDIHAKILEAVAKFWKSIEDNDEPKPDFKRDAKFLISLNQKVSPEKVIPMDEKMETLARAYRIATQLENSAKEDKEKAKAELLTLIGDAEKVKGEKYSISAGYNGPVRIEAYDRAGYRDFRITEKKEKK